jgi:DNA-directed RNA polymerase
MTYEKYAFDNAYENHPLIDVPLDWQQSEEAGRHNMTGGYHLPQLRRRQPMCRGKGIHDSVFGTKSADMQNTLQRTAWRIDSRVLDVAEKLSEGHVSIGKFLVVEFDRPRKGEAPLHYLDNPGLMKEWRSERARLHRAYGEQDRKCVRTRKAMCMAREYRHKTFYLSWFVDWRGRFYCQQSWLAPVGATDFEKSLLKFRDGCKVTEQAMRWIYSAIGSAFKGTKISTNERIRWTVDNKSLIEEVANNPLDTVEIWSTADEPWTFLQLCFEWNDVLVTKKESFWKVPLQVDSTASGLQLLSGMRRDPVGMKNTNLLPPDTADSPPEDAYIKVLANAKAIAEQKDQKHLIKYLQFRSVGKPVVMTAIYGAKAFSFKQKIEDALLKAAENGELREDELPTDAVLWELASLIHQATKEVFPAAFQALDWLRKLAKAAHENGSQSLVWKTPTNDTIHLVKYKHESTEIYTSFNGKIIFSDYDREKVNYAKEVSSFVPAVVHSYDAALLKESFADWRHPLSVIHDCVLILPNDMDRAMDRIRDGFASIVDGDPLARLADDLGVSECSLKRLPQLSQDLACVQASRYMFN